MVKTIIARVLISVIMEKDGGDRNSQDYTSSPSRTLNERLGSSLKHLQPSICDSYLYNFGALRFIILIKEFTML